MANRRTAAGLALVFLAGCSAVSPAQERPPPPAQSAVAAASSWSRAQKVFDARCVVCHGCFDAPCQLKLDSFEGIERGANPARVYAQRPLAIEPTRLFIDARNATGWRKKGFHANANAALTIFRPRRTGWHGSSRHSGQHQESAMKIEQVMSRPVITCRARDVLNAAAGLMWENDCGALPVVDEQGALIGMITDRDICMAAYTSGGNLHSISVGDAMAKKVLTCLATDDIGDAEKVMGKAQVRRLPVVDDQGCPIAIVSMSDIARTSVNADKKTVAGALSTLAAICEPRHRSMMSVAPWSEAVVMPAPALS